MTDLPYLASRIYGAPLLIARPKLELILGVMDRKLRGESLRSPVTTEPERGEYTISEGVAVIPILGTLVRRAAYLGAVSGLTSYHAIEAMAEDAFADPAVKAVLLEIDSSGGEAGGVFDLAQRLRSLAQETGKPLWAISDEAALSAAYALACAADQLWLTRTAEVGSIGVVSVHVDESVADAKAGLSYTFLHAGSHKIDGHPHAPLTAAVASDIQSDIDGLYQQFVALVAGFRPLTPEAIGETQARVYRGKAAIRAGLADQIGTRSAVLTALQTQLARPALRLTGMSLTPRSDSVLPLSRLTSNPLEITMTEQHPNDDPQNNDTQNDPLNPESTTTTSETAQDNAHPDTVKHDDPAVSLDEAAITAQVETRLRQQLAKLTEIAAQAKRLGVTVDPAHALTQGIRPDALRQSVLKQAAERGIAEDIIAQGTAPTGTPSPTQSAANSPLVQAAKTYGVRS